MLLTRGNIFIKTNKISLSIFKIEQMRDFNFLIN